MGMCLLFLNMVLLRWGICKEPAWPRNTRYFKYAGCQLTADIIHHDNRAETGQDLQSLSKQGEETVPDSAWKNAQEIPAVENYATPRYGMRKKTPEKW